MAEHAPTGEQPLAHRVAVITGASRGIGAAAARAFAGAGAAVALAARDMEALEELADDIRGSGGTAVVVPADVTKPDAVRRMVETTLEAFGRLDVAFNNAGGGGRGRAPVADTALEEFDAVLDVNLRGTFLCLKYEIPAMLASGGGAIVNASSTAGLTGAAPGISPYTSAKHGVQGLTKTAALDYAAQGIRVNAIAPGPIRTDVLARLPEDQQRQIAELVPLRRLGNPDDIAAAAVWLCTDQSAFITGTTLTIDGGKLAGVA